MRLPSITLLALLAAAAMDASPGSVDGGGRGPAEARVQRHRPRHAAHVRGGRLAARWHAGDGVGAAGRKRGVGRQGSDESEGRPCRLSRPLATRPPLLPGRHDERAVPAVDRAAWGAGGRARSGLRLHCLGSRAMRLKPTAEKRPSRAKARHMPAKTCAASHPTHALLPLQALIKEPTPSPPLRCTLTAAAAAQTRPPPPPPRHTPPPQLPASL